MPPILVAQAKVKEGVERECCELTAELTRRGSAKGSCNSTSRLYTTLKALRLIGLRQSFQMAVLGVLGSGTTHAGTPITVRRCLRKYSASVMHFWNLIVCFLQSYMKSA